MIEISGLTKEYSGRNIIDNLDLRIDKGELFGFLGPNGAGKTTLIRILTTLTKPSSGRVNINGLDVTKDTSKVKSQFGIVQQHLSLNRDLTVSENLELHARLHHLSYSERKKRINELLDYVDMVGSADELIDRLSGGMRRRIMIARALIHRPTLLFLDEPTVGVDAQTRRRVWDLIRRMNSDGTTVFMTTHYIEEAETLCNRVGIIHHGKLISLGSPLNLRKKLGMITVETKENTHVRYNYFPNREDASKFIQKQNISDKVVMRQSNLEDVFIELTGQKVVDE